MRSAQKEPNDDYRCLSPQSSDVRIRLVCKWANTCANCSLYSIPDGLQTLTNAMRALFSGAVLWFSLAAITALAQSYPSRPIRMIVPFPPSAGVDVVARLLGVGLTERTGQNVVIDNRIGAGGTIGIDAAARAPADGSTLLAVPTSHAVNESLYKKLSYDAVRDFAAITLVATTPNVRVTSLGVPATSVKE